MYCLHWSQAVAEQQAYQGLEWLTTIQAHRNFVFQSKISYNIQGYERGNEFTQRERKLLKPLSPQTIGPESRTYTLKFQLGEDVWSGSAVLG